MNIKDIIKSHGDDDLVFFQTAYLYKFNRLVDVWGDVLAFRVQGTVPKYVEDYARTLT